MDEKKIGWHFPASGYGQSNGISDSGIETFKGALLTSLVREICQNSLDANRNKDKAVYIEFEKTFIDKSDIPDFLELNKAINECYKYAKEENNEKTIKFFRKAIEAISNKVSVLRISDYNTIGLVGSNDDTKNNPWRNLVKANGISDKGGKSGGSYGIGKSAPFACSEIRTIFYRTLDKNGVKAVQGISKLISYPINGDDMTTGIGYYGIKEKNKPIRNIEILDKINKRTESGTDLFVLSFIEKEDWNKCIVGELLEHFMMSFYRGLLVVKVDNEIINKDNLGEMLNKYSDYCSTVKDYYKVITESTIECVEDFEGMGNLKLKILLGEGLNRTVLLTRSNGMKLFDKNRMPRSIQFSAVLQMEGDKLNSYFRKMESPQHNAWEPDRYEEKSKEADRKLKTLYKWIKRKITDLSKCGDGDELDAEGVGDLIPDLFDSNKVGKNKEENVGGSLQNIQFKIAEKTSIKKINKYGTNNKEIEEKIGNGVLDDSGQYTVKGLPKGKSNEGYGGSGSGLTQPGAMGDGNNSLHNYKEVANCHMRMFVSNTDKSEYTFNFSCNKNINKVRLAVEIAGEQSNIKVNVKKAYINNSERKNIKHIENFIFLDNVIKNQRNSIIFQLDDEEIYSLEVKVYES